MRVGSVLVLSLLDAASGEKVHSKVSTNNLGHKITTEHDRECSRPAPATAHCSLIFGCTGNCDHEWCAKDRKSKKEDESKCRWTGSLEAEKCESKGGCLDYSKPLHDCSENCKGPDCRVCVFTCKDALDKTRNVEAMLMEENAKYELIFDHPDYKCSDLPITMPAHKKDWPTADCHKDSPFCHQDLDPQACHGHETERKKGDATYFFLGEEFKYCRDAHDAAERYVKAKYDHMKYDDTPMDLDDGSCTNQEDPDVEWEFEGVKYKTCALAVNAAFDREKAARAAEAAARGRPQQLPGSQGAPRQGVPPQQQAPSQQQPGDNSWYKWFK